MKRSTFGHLAVPALAMTLALAACGGGSSSSDSSTTADAAASGDASMAASGESSMAAVNASGTLNGAGASSQQAAQEAWNTGAADLFPDLVVNYDPAGSGAGREQFLAGGVDFAGSDAALKDEELTSSQTSCASADGAIDIPVYISPIAVVYNLPEVKDLQLAPATIAGIFAGKITSWDDAAIKADNPSATLPATAITPVHRSDKSGTSGNFTAYLAAAAPDAWTPGSVEEWPADLGGEGASGTSGVIAAVTAGAGAVGYADASQAGDLGTAKVKVGEKYIAYSPEAAAAVLDESQLVTGRGKYDLAIDVNRTTTADGVYPIVLVSYAIACLKYKDPATAANVKAYLGYIAGADGQKAAAEAAGSAPLPASYIEKAAASIAAIS